jgi:2-C-methyl-D-erythritol 4-phosphate cytidylyltransferase
VEAAGGTVVLVPGRTTNIKVTTADDFAVAEAMARV